MRFLIQGTILANTLFIAQPAPAVSTATAVGVSDLTALVLLLVGMLGLSLAGSHPKRDEAIPARSLPTWRGGSRGSTAGAALLVLLVLLLPAGVSHATPLFAFGDHTGEDHSFENHDKEILNDIILSSADLTSTNLSKSVLTNAIMISAILTGADIEKTDFGGADLSGSAVTGTAAKNAVFTGAILDGTDFSGSDVKNADFTGASLLGADFSSLANADKADFTGAFYDAATILDPGIDTSGMILVPEPATALLVVAGLAGFSVRIRRGGA